MRGSSQPLSGREPPTYYAADRTKGRRVAVRQPVPRARLGEAFRGYFKTLFAASSVKVRNEWASFRLTHSLALRASIGFWNAVQALPDVDFANQLDAELLFDIGCDEIN
jgi:hypothetical protein